MTIYKATRFTDTVPCPAKMSVVTNARTSTVATKTKSNFKRKLEDMQKKQCVNDPRVNVDCYDWFHSNNLLQKAHKGLLDMMSSQASSIIDASMSSNYRSAKNFMQLNRITTEHHLIPFLHDFLHEYELQRDGAPFNKKSEKKKKV